MKWISNHLSIILRSFHNSHSKFPQMGATSIYSYVYVANLTVGLDYEYFGYCYTLLRSTVWECLPVS